MSKFYRKMVTEYRNTAGVKEWSPDKVPTLVAKKSESFTGGWEVS